MTHAPIRPGRRFGLLLLLALVLAAGPLLLSARPAQAAQTFVVNLVSDEEDFNIADPVCDVSTAAGNQCTLRAAIQEANDTRVADTIRFRIPGDPDQPKVIRPNDPATPGGRNGRLPELTAPVTIDGYTQPGSSVNTATTGTNAQIRIGIYGTFTKGSSSNFGLSVTTTSNSAIRGLAIGGFDRGIYVGAYSAPMLYRTSGSRAASSAPTPRGASVGPTAPASPTAVATRRSAAATPPPATSSPATSTASRWVPTGTGGGCSAT